MQILLLWTYLTIFSAASPVQWTLAILLSNPYVVNASCLYTPCLLFTIHFFFFTFLQRVSLLLYFQLLPSLFLISLNSLSLYWQTTSLSHQCRHDNPLPSAFHKCPQLNPSTGQWTNMTGEWQLKFPVLALRLGLCSNLSCL